MKTPPKFKPTSTLPRFYEGAASGRVDPGDLATKVGVRPHGAWLTAYMIRRFGPPLCGCDNYKNLCEWSLTTPMKGVWLSVTPYLGDDGTERYEGSNSLSFGYRFSKSVTLALKKPAKKQRDAYKKFYERALVWAHAKGVCWCWKEGDEEQTDEFLPVSKFAPSFNESSEKNPVLVWSPEDGPRLSLSYLRRLRPLSIIDHYIDAGHKRVDFPRGSKMMKIRIESALKKTLKELLHPVWVRDLCLTINGEGNEASKTSADEHPHSGHGMMWAVPEPKKGRKF